MAQRVLTGITTTGTPHLGNYVGAIRPCIRASRAPDVDSFFFMADYHALIKCDTPERIERSRLEITALWLAAGLDTQRATLYRQSDIPEIPELTWLLTCVTAKGLMNRAHAYKGAADANLALGEDIDAGISMGLFSYPILMAADILMFNAHRVPVGRDQVQHIEMARDIAQRFNHLFGTEERPLFVLPEAEVEADIELLPGLDGRKMSKSYNNTIPLLEGGTKATREAISRIVTDSRLPGEPKETEGCALVTLFDAFADEAARANFRDELRQGLGWGEAKQKLAAQIELEIGPMREVYADLMAHPERVEDVLQDGARKARAIATPFLKELRHAVGLRPMVALTPKRADAAGEATAARKAELPVFKQYREADGLFYFKLNTAKGALLLQSAGLASGKDAGRWVSQFKTQGAAALQAGAPAHLAEGVSAEQLDEALNALREAAAKS